MPQAPSRPAVAIAKWAPWLVSVATHATEGPSFAEAEAACRRATELNPDLGLAHNNLGNALAGLQRYGEAEASYASVSKSSLDDMTAFAPVMDVLAAMHVQADVRMFMN